MRLNLHARIYRLLWRFMPKQKVQVKGFNIEYATLPWWMLVNGHDTKGIWGRGRRGLSYTYVQSRTIMIFLPREETPETIQCLAYHEYLEGCFILKVGPAANETTLRQAVANALRILIVDAPEIDSLIRNHVRRGGNRGHAFALLLELEYAKEQMVTSRYKAYLADALETRI